jgi:hypothetical protein
MSRLAAATAKGLSLIQKSPGRLIVSTAAVISAS